jgi:hypothetical protein
MDNSFFLYLERLELMAFFSGYSVIYAITLFTCENLQKKNNFNSRVASLLPFAYAFVGILYLGFELKKLYPDYSVENIKLTVQQPYLIIWGFLSILFWIPALAKWAVLSLIHSLVFFLFLVKDIFLQLSAPSADKNILKNDMKMYIVSLFLNLAAFGLIILFSFLLSNYKKRLSS